MVRIEVSELISSTTPAEVRAVDTTVARVVSRMVLDALDQGQTVLLSFDKVKGTSAPFLFQSVARVHLLSRQADRDLVVVGLCTADHARLEALIKEAHDLRDILRAPGAEPTAAIA